MSYCPRSSLPADVLAWLAISTIHGDLLWCDGGWPGSCHEQELLALSGLDGVLDATGVATILDRGFRGRAKLREHWHAPVGDRRTRDRLTDGQRAFNRLQAQMAMELPTPTRARSARTVPEFPQRSCVTRRPPGDCAGFTGRQGVHLRARP